MTSTVPAGEGSLRSLYRHYLHLLTAERDDQGAILSSRGFGRYVPDASALRAAHLARGSFDEFRAAILEALQAPTGTGSIGPSRTDPSSAARSVWRAASTPCGTSR
jgi:hypothetical protein